MKISAIVAIGKNREMGLNNQLLWHIKEDFKNFKAVTMGHLLIMGRKTYESIGRPLPGRETVILTRDKTYNAHESVKALSSINEAIEYAHSHKDKEVFICGGANIYEQFMPYVHTLHLSLVDFAGEADTFFPEYEQYKWTKKREKDFESTDKSPAWRYLILEKSAKSLK